jgi:hypothetical protein
MKLKSFKSELKDKNKNKKIKKRVNLNMLQDKNLMER